VAKTKTLDEIERMQAKAVRFVTDVLGDEDRAAEIEGESPEGYAARKKIGVINPNTRRYKVARTIQDYKDEIRDLKDEVAQLEETNEGLQEQLDGISEILSPEDTDEDDDGEPE